MRPSDRAHPTVRESYLEGARWIDPAEYGENGELEARQHNEALVAEVVPEKGT